MAQPDRRRKSPGCALDTLPPAPRTWVSSAEAHPRLRSRWRAVVAGLGVVAALALVAAGLVAFVLLVLRLLVSAGPSLDAPPDVAAQLAPQQRFVPFHVGGADEVTNPTKSVFCDAAVAAPGSAMTVDRVVRLLNTGGQGWMLVESAPERLL
jgi:hypothetical protein